MHVHVGRRASETAIPQGHLPLFAVSTEAEAMLLTERALEHGFITSNGGYQAYNRREQSGYVGIAVELAAMQTQENLAEASRQLAAVHRTIEADGLCECNPDWWTAFLESLPDEDEEEDDLTCTCGHLEGDHDGDECMICECDLFE